MSDIGNYGFKSPQPGAEKYERVLTAVLEDKEVMTGVVHWKG